MCGKMRDKVETAIETIRSALQADGGDIELIDVTEDGEVRVRLTGACAGCPMSKMTLSFAVESELKKMVPGVKRVVGI